MARGRPSKKTQIVKAAAHLFSELGYQGTSIDQVVIRAQVSKPTVYSNFPSKQALWVSVLELTLESSEVIESTVGNTWQQTWCNFWSAWTADEVRLSTYRIMLGEPYKMEVASHALFEALGSLCEANLRQLITTEHGCILADEEFEWLMALSKQVWLLPALQSRPEARLSQKLKEEKFKHWSSNVKISGN